MVELCVVVMALEGVGTQLFLPRALNVFYVHQAFLKLKTCPTTFLR